MRSPSRGRKALTTMAASGLFVAVSVAAGCGPSYTPEELHARVTDHAGLLTAPQQRELESALASFEDTTTNQFLLLTVPSLGGRNVNSYMKDVTDFNGFGTALRKNGLLVLVVLDSGAVAIEAGPGIVRSLDSSGARLRAEQQIRAGVTGRNAYPAIREGFATLISAAPKRFTPDPIYRDAAKQH